MTDLGPWGVEGSYPALPDRWGEGALFAFSGMDGPTCSESGFVATTMSTPGAWLFHTPCQRVLHVAWGAPVSFSVVTGDLVLARSALGPVGAVYPAWHSLVGWGVGEAQVALMFAKEIKSAGDENPQVTWDPEHGDALVLCTGQKRWAVSYGTSVEEAMERAKWALTVDLQAVVKDRLALYRTLPAIAEPRYARLFAKCVSVMRVNTLAPEGVITSHWSTPDRVPHRHMWLWDSVFHSLGMNALDPQLGWEFLEAVLERQRADGMIPHCMHVDGTISDITQPPLLAWGVWQTYMHLGDRESLRYALPRLEAYLMWNLQHRDRNNNGLLEWHIEASPTCRSGESGMDNSPRFDEALRLDAVDFSAFQSLDMLATSQIAAVFGERDRAQEWRRRAQAMAARVYRSLWCAEAGIYCDRLFDGRLSRVKAVSGFSPLLLPGIPADHIAALVEHLSIPHSFGAAFPIPSVSLDDPAWSTDMWRGATWINYDYLVALGLMHHGQREAAEGLIEAVLRYVNTYYEQYGVVFEFYDAQDKIPPLACDRKGPHRDPYDIRVKMDSIRDYHWTAALVAALLAEQIGLPWRECDSI